MKLSKREIVLLYMLAITLVVILSVVFVILPLSTKLNNAKKDYSKLSTELIRLEAQERNNKAMIAKIDATKADAIAKSDGLIDVVDVAFEAAHNYIMDFLDGQKEDGTNRNMLYKSELSFGGIVPYVDADKKTNENIYTLALNISIKDREFQAGASAVPSDDEAMAISACQELIHSITKYNENVVKYKYGNKDADTKDVYCNGFVLSKANYSVETSTKTIANVGISLNIYITALPSEVTA